MLTNVLAQIRKQTDADEAIRGLQRYRLFQDKKMLNAFLEKFKITMEKPLPVDTSFFTDNLVKDKRWISKILEEAQPKVKAISNLECMDLHSITQMTPVEFYASIYVKVSEVFEEMLESEPTEAEKKAARTDADFAMKQKKRNFTVQIAVSSVLAIEKLTDVAGIPSYSGITGKLVHKLITHTTDANAFIAAIPRILKLAALYQQVQVKLSDNIARAAKSGTNYQIGFGRIMCFILIQEFLRHMPDTYKHWFKADDMYGSMWDEIMNKKIEEERWSPTRTKQQQARV